MGGKTEKKRNNRGPGRRNAKAMHVLVGKIGQVRTERGTFDSFREMINPIKGRTQGEGYVAKGKEGGSQDLRRSVERRGACVRFWN